MAEIRGSPRGHSVAERNEDLGSISDANDQNYCEDCWSMKTDILTVSSFT